MASPESFYSPETQHEQPTTVLDAYEAVMSLDEETVSRIAMSVWNDLAPQDRETLRTTARDAYPSIAQSALYAQQLLIFEHVNRAHEQPPLIQGSET